MAGEIRIALIGHKDHGKSTLIGRLLHDSGSMSEDRVNEARAVCRSMGREFELAFLLDSFVEEREDGFTLDTTMAQVRHRGRIYNMIDVPGHKELVRNMLSGASMAEAAILMISAKEGEGLQDETRLHMYLARMLGITELIIAVNKMDAAGFGRDRFDRIRMGISEVLEGFGFDSARLTFIPISARNGDNVFERSEKMPWYQGETLIGLMEKASKQDFNGALQALPGRMFVQDAYPSPDGVLAVGRVESGSFREGQEVVIGPETRRARVVELHGKEGKRVDEVRAGQNAGMRFGAGERVGRGDVCMDAGHPAMPSKKIAARIFCLPEATIRAGERVTLSCASQDTEARISIVLSRFSPISERRPREVNAESDIGGSEAADVQLETVKAIVVEKFSEIPPMGRFTISSKGKIAGIGIVL